MWSLRGSAASVALSRVSVDTGSCSAGCGQGKPLLRSACRVASGKMEAWLAHSWVKQRSTHCLPFAVAVSILLPSTVYSRSPGCRASGACVVLPSHLSIDMDVYWKHGSCERTKPQSSLHRLGMRMVELPMAAPLTGCDARPIVSRGKGTHSKAACIASWPGAVGQWMLWSLALICFS